MSRKGSIGQILTSFPSIIFLLLVIIAYILISSFIVRDNIQSYNLAEDFLDDYVVYENNVVTVRDSVKFICDDFSKANSLGIVLEEHFSGKYGLGNSFAFVSRDYGGTGGWGYILHGKYGAFQDLTNEAPKIQRFDFEKVFDIESKGVVRTYFCDADNFALYLKEGQ